MSLSKSPPAPRRTTMACLILAVALSTLYYSPAHGFSNTPSPCYNHRPNTSLRQAQTIPAQSQSSQLQQQQQQRKNLVTLFAEKKQKGVYVRPSGAIERGSGFFVPGLEGPRVRLVFGGVLLALTAINHALALSDQPFFSLEESIAVVYSLLVLFQAAIEFGKEELIIEGQNSSGPKSASAPTSNTENLVQKWSGASLSNQLSEEYKSRVQWAAASYLAVTPATQMLLLENDGITYQLGDDVKATSDYDAGVRAALEQLQKSKGGRIALPATHPAVVALGMDDARTVVLQRITDDSCWMMSSSDQLLASFASSDLKWLGQLGAYVASPI